MPHLGIAVATTLGGWLNALLLHRTLVARGEFEADARLKRTLPLIAAACLVMGAVLWFAAGVLAPSFASSTGFIERMVALAALVCAGLVVYTLAILLLGVLSLRQLRGFLGQSRPAA